MKTAPNYLNPEIPSGLQRVTIPIVEATAESLAGYGHIVSDTDEVEIEIVRWPAQGHREVDPDSGDEGGTTEGLFICEWKGDILYGRNSAVSGNYILGYGTEPKKADEHHTRDPKTLLVWHANYHPDGGQCFFPETKTVRRSFGSSGRRYKSRRFCVFSFQWSRGSIHPSQCMARGSFRNSW